MRRLPRSVIFVVSHCYLSRILARKNCDIIGLAGQPETICWTNCDDTGMIFEFQPLIDSIMYIKLFKYIVQR